MLVLVRHHEGDLGLGAPRFPVEASHADQPVADRRHQCEPVDAVDGGEARHFGVREPGVHREEAQVYGVSREAPVEFDQARGVVGSDGAHAVTQSVGGRDVPLESDGRRDARPPRPGCRGCGCGHGATPGRLGPTTLRADASARRPPDRPTLDRECDDPTMTAWAVDRPGPVDGAPLVRLRRPVPQPGPGPGPHPGPRLRGVPNGPASGRGRPRAAPPPASHPATRSSARSTPSGRAAHAGRKDSASACRGSPRTCRQLPLLPLGTGEPLP